MGRLLLRATVVQGRDLSPTQTLSEIAARGHGVSICGDVQNLSGHSLGQPAADDPDDL